MTKIIYGNYYSGLTHIETSVWNTVVTSIEINIRWHICNSIGFPVGDSVRKSISNSVFNSVIETINEMNKREQETTEKF